MTTEHAPTRGRHFYGPGPYVERDVDDALYEALRGSEYALVLGPRGVGKTSLRIRASQRLAAAGVRVATVDLGAIGAESRPDAFCASLLIEAGRSLGLEDEAKLAWRRSKGPAHLRLQSGLREVILDDRPETDAETGPVVLFIDELEIVRALGPARDDLFGVFRAMADARGHDDAWSRLTLCLVGALTRDEFIRDPRRSAFDLPARDIAPRDFSREQLDAFAPTLEPLAVDTKALLDALYDWTSGHPALVQWIAGDLLLREVARGEEATAVEAVIRETILQRGPEVDPLLGETARRLRRDQRDPWRTRTLAAYERVLAGERIDLRGRQLGSDGALVVARLKVAGLVAAAAGGKLRVRNKVIERAFDRNWVRRALTGRPVSEALDRWESGGRRPAHLLRGGDLERAFEWLEGRPDVTTNERDFVLASERSRAQRLRRVLYAGGALCLSLGTLLGVALWQYRAVLDEPLEPTVIRADASADASAGEAVEAAAPPDTSEPEFVIQTRQAVEIANNLDANAELVDGLRGEIDILGRRLAIERAQRAELLADLPERRGEGLSLALTALQPWAAALEQAPAPVTRALTANLASPGDTLTIPAHDTAVVELVSNGDRIVTVAQLGDRSAEIKVWSAASGRRLAAIDSPAEPSGWISLSPNGQYLAATTRGEALTTWGLGDGTTHGPAPIAPPMSPADGTLGRTLAIAHLQVDDAGGVLVRRADGSVDAVEPAEGNASARVSASAIPDDIALDHATVLPPRPGSPPRVATISDDTLELWDPLAGRPVASVPAPAMPTGVAELAIVPGGRMLLVRAHAGTSIASWEFASGTVAAIAERESPILAIASSDDGRLVAVGTQAGGVSVWSLDGRLVAELRPHTSAVTALAFVRGGVASADRSGELHVQPLRKRDRPPARYAALGPEGRALTLALGEGPSGAALWRDGLDRLGPLPTVGLGAPVVRAAVDLDGERIALAFEDGRAALFRAELHHGGSPIGPDASEALARFEGRVLDLAMAPSGEVLAVASEARTVSLWDGDGQPIATLAGHEAPVDLLAMASDGSRLASSDRAGGLRVWDPNTAALLATFVSEPAARAIAVSGTHVLALDDAGVATIWALADREVSASVDVGRDAVDALAVSADGSQLAIARGGAVELWRTDTGEAIGRFRASAPALALRFSDDDEPSLILVDADSVTTRWSTDPLQWLRSGCGALAAGSVLPTACTSDE